MNEIKSYDEMLNTLKNVRNYLKVARADDCVDELDKVAKYLINKKNNNPTEEQVLKEFEKLGYEWWEYKEQKVFEMCKYDKTNGNLFFQGKIEIDLDDKEYWSDIQFTIKEHQLLTKLFKALGWFE